MRPFEPQLAVGRVLDDGQVVPAGDVQQHPAARQRPGPAGGVLELRHHVDKPATLAHGDSVLQRPGQHSLFIRRHRHELRPVAAEGADRRQVGRSLAEDRVALVQEHLPDQVERLLRARRHEHLLRWDLRAAALLHLARDQRPQRGNALRGRVLERRRAVAMQHLAEQGLDPLHREALARRQSAPEGDHVALRRQLQHLAHRRGPEPRRAPGEPDGHPPSCDFRSLYVAACPASSGDPVTDRLDPPR